MGSNDLLGKHCSLLSCSLTCRSGRSRPAETGRHLNGLWHEGGLSSYASPASQGELRIMSPCGEYQLKQRHRLTLHVAPTLGEPAEEELRLGAPARGRPPPRWPRPAPRSAYGLRSGCWVG